MNTQESLKFINKYAKHLDRHDLKPIVAIALCKEIGKQTGVYVRVGDYTINYPYLNIERPLSYDVKAIVKELKTILKTRGLSLQKAQLYDDCRFSLDKINPHKNREEALQGYGAKSLHVLYILRYLVNGEPENNYSNSQNWLIENGVAPSLDAYEFTYEGIHVKSFLNGRIDVQGLTKEQNKRLQTLFEIKNIIEKIRVNRYIKFSSHA